MNVVRRLSSGFTGGEKHFELKSPMVEDETPKGQNVEKQDVVYLLAMLKDDLDAFPESEAYFEMYKRVDADLVGEDKDHDYEKMMESALGGNGTAQFNLARRYLDVGKVAGCLYWYGEAAGNMNLKAMNNLGLMYVDGTGVPKNERTATMWLECAAKRGDVNAMGNLGILILRPSDKENRDYEGALKYFTEAAKFDIPLALNNLACCYVRGFGTKVDYKKAKRLFSRAQALHSLVAEYNIGVLYLNGLGMRPNAGKAQKHFDLVDQSKNHPEYKCMESVREDPTKLVFFTTMVYYTHDNFVL